MGLDRSRGRGRLEDAHRIGRRRRKDLFPWGVVRVEGCVRPRERASKLECVSSDVRAAATSSRDDAAAARPATSDRRAPGETL